MEFSQSVILPNFLKFFLYKNDNGYLIIIYVIIVFYKMSLQNIGEIL